MSEKTDREATLIDEAADRAAARLRPMVQLTRDQLDDMLAMISEWRYEKQREKNRRDRFPWLFAAISTTCTVITVAIALFVNFFQSGGHK